MRRRGFHVVDPWRSTRRTVYVTGSPRSGTTWVAETLAAAATTRLVFEPLHHRARAARSAPHLAEPGSDGGIARAIGDAVTGRVRDPWVNALQRRAIVSRRVVKDIRPGLLPAVRTVAPDVPVVLVVRDPVAVARSRARLEAAHGDWFRTAEALAELRRRAAPDTRVDAGPDAGSDDELRRLCRRAVAVLDGPRGGDPLVDHVVLWCVENSVALAAVGGPGRAVVVRYEELRADPARGFGELAAAIGVPRRALGDPAVASSTEFASGPGVELDAASREVLVGIVRDAGLDRFLAGAGTGRPH